MNPYADVITWLHTDEGELWSECRFTRVVYWYSERRGAFGSILPLSEVGNVHHAYSPLDEKLLRMHTRDYLYEPETVKGLSCPALSHSAGS